MKIIVVHVRLTNIFQSLIKSIQKLKETIEVSAIIIDGFSKEAEGLQKLSLLGISFDEAKLIEKRSWKDLRTNKLSSLNKNMPVPMKNESKKTTKFYRRMMHCNKR